MEHMDITDFRYRLDHLGEEYGNIALIRFYPDGETPYGAAGKTAVDVAYERDADGNQRVVFTFRPSPDGEVVSIGRMYYLTEKACAEIGEGDLYLFFLDGDGYNVGREDGTTEGMDFDICYEDDPDEVHRHRFLY